MAAPYIPPTSSGLDAFANTFQTLIAASPGTYGLTSADAVNITLAYNNYHSAYLLGGTLAGGHTPVNPSTRTPTTVAAMRTQQQTLVALIRTYAAQIRLNPAVANGDKTALGLTLPNTTPSPVPAPTSNPVLSLVQQGHLTIQISYKDSLAGTSKAKAPGAIQMQIVGGPSATPFASPDTAPLLPAQTKSPFQLSFASGTTGQVANMWGRWVTRKGLTGPWSPMFSATVT